MSILDEILENKRKELLIKKREVRINLDGINKPIPFLSSFTKDKIFFIAEIKKGSPSKGIIRPDFDPFEIASLYAKGGVDAISVLTDEKYFFGCHDNIKIAKRASALPILRKDFIIDEYQVGESLYIGASAILLIVSCLSLSTLTTLLNLARSYGMESLVEVHDKEELFIALRAGASIIGINNRDLNTFETSVETTKELIKYIPKDCIVISESGIKDRDTIDYLATLGVNGFLIGEAFMSSDDIESKLRDLIA